MKAKHIFKSRTFWVGMATICAGVADLALVGEFEGFAILVIGVVFTIMRAITKEPVKF